jgi:hypothetical protein
MSTVEMDHYWPMAEGPGAGADFARWRRMASIWSNRSGVVRDVGDQFHFNGWVEPGMVSIGSGAVWATCAYGEMGLDPYRHLWLSAPGDDGMVVAVMDPTAGHVRLEFQPGYHGGDWSDPSGGTQMNLWELSGFGTVTDRRRYVPEPAPPPPITVIPPHVPGRIVTAQELDVGWTGGDGGNPMVMYLGWRPDYVAPRHYRFTFDMRQDNWNATSTNGWGYAGTLFAFVRDQTGVRMRFKMGGPQTGSTQAGVVRLEAKVITFVCPNCWGDLVAAFEQRVEATQAGGAWAYAAGCLRIEAEEIGADW